MSAKSADILEFKVNGFTNDYIGLFQIIMNLPLWRTSEFHTFFSPFCIGIHTFFGNFALESILFSAMFLEFLTFVCHRFGKFRHFSDMNFGISYYFQFVKTVFRD